MKKRYQYRFSDDTISKLDSLVKFENEGLKNLGIIGVSYDRTKILELLIEKAHQLMQEGKSIQDV